MSVQGLTSGKLLNFGAPEYKEDCAALILLNWIAETSHSTTANGTRCRGRVRIYEEALVNFCGGEENCAKRLPIRRDGFDMEKHACRLYNDDCAFVLTGLKPGGGRKAYHTQLQSLANALPIQAFQWINVHHQDVSFVTVLG